MAVGLVDRAISEAVGYRVEDVHYSPGGIRRRASYRMARITGRAEFEAVKASAPVGLKFERGLLVTSAGRGKRQAWRISGARWVRSRVWSVSGDVWVRGRRRVGRWAVESVVESNGARGCRVTAYEGAAASVTGRAVVGSPVVVHNEDSRAALRWVVKKCVVGPYRRHNRDEAVSTARLLRRLCPVGWAVEVSEVSAGGDKRPAFREVSTGEVYHFPLRYSGRSPVAEALVAFERRAAARDQAELAAAVERGEAAGVFVCAVDSYRAGNCRAGTASFAGRHGLDLRRHYRAAELATIANGDGRMVRAAVVSALRRERREAAAGVCVLSEHRAE